MSIMKRLVLSGLIACAMLAAFAHGQANGDAKPATAATPSVWLKDAFAGKFLIGTAGDVPKGFSDAELANIKGNYNVITPDNCMKPQSVHPSEDTYNWATADAMVQWCQDNNIKVWGHTLCWHAQTPNWFFQGTDGEPITREQAMERLANHIVAEVGRYKGRVLGWDVVNEALNDAGSGETENLRNSNWYKAIGPDYLTLAFKWAHQADPQAQLYYNDYNLEQGTVQNTGKHASSMLLLKRLLKEGAPINGVGIEGHWNLGTSIPDIEKAIADYGSLGLKVCISEMDVAISGANNAALNAGGAGGPVSPELLAQQAQVYAKLFDVLNRHANTISRVTFWGINDRRSWRSSQSPLLFDAQMQPKPAYQAILDVVLGKYF
jgi:endo-1,4-beta-xylanase